jgi:hypothetical protein
MIYYISRTDKGALALSELKPDMRLEPDLVEVRAVELKGLPNPELMDTIWDNAQTVWIK